jgi:hypothetical protein
MREREGEINEWKNEQERMGEWETKICLKRKIP